MDKSRAAYEAWKEEMERFSKLRLCDVSAWRAWQHLWAEIERLEAAFEDAIGTQLDYQGELYKAKARVNRLEAQKAELEHIEAVAHDVNHWLCNSAGLKGTAHQRSLEQALQGEGE